MSNCFQAIVVEILDVVQHHLHAQSLSNSSEINTATRDVPALHRLHLVRQLARDRWRLRDHPSQPRTTLLKSSSRTDAGNGEQKDLSALEQAMLCGLPGGPELQQTKVSSAQGDDRHNHAWRLCRYMSLLN